MFRKLLPLYGLLHAAVADNNAGGGAVTTTAVEKVSANPLSADIKAQVETKLAEPKEIAFHFRKDADLEKDNPALKGKTKRETYKQYLPMLTRAGVLAAMQADDKSTQLVVDLANDAIINRMRGLIADKIDGDQFNKETLKWGIALKPEMFDLNLLSFLVIANLPKSERGAGIAKEQWASFTTDYVETMQLDAAVALLQDKKKRSPEVLAKHAQILGGKFNAVRSRKDVIQQMLGFLDVWVQASPNAEDNMECYEHLKAKGEALLKAENFDDL